MENNRKHPNEMDGRQLKPFTIKLTDCTKELGEGYNHPVEIKQEADIKEEPQWVGELIEVPVMRRINDGDVSDSNEYPVEYDFEHLEVDEVKTEVKTEIDEKRKEISKSSDDLSDDRGENPMQQPQDEQNPITMEFDDSVNNVVQKKTTSNKYMCDVCQYSAKYKSQLDIHMLKHTGERPFGCDCCQKSFKSKRSLQTHKKAHVKEFLFHCNSCLNGFHDKDEKKKHEAHCKTIRYECHLCKQSFGLQSANLIRHMRTHTGNRPFACTECIKEFTTKQSLNNHMKLHANSPLLRCSKCYRAFLQQNEQQLHEAKCNPNMYECHICGKFFGRYKRKLEQHMRVHSGSRPFQCQKCLKQYKYKHTFDAHMKLHTKDLPFKCSICHDGFTKKTQCKAHERNCRRRCYHCHVCKKFFGGNKFKLKGHMASHTGKKNFGCKLCQRRFTLKSNLHTHMKRRIHKQIK